MKRQGAKDRKWKQSKHKKMSREEERTKLLRGGEERQICFLCKRLDGFIL